MTTGTLAAVSLAFETQKTCFLFNILFVFSNVGLFSIAMLLLHENYKLLNEMLNPRNIILDVSWPATSCEEEGECPLALRMFPWDDSWGCEWAGHCSLLTKASRLNNKFPCLAPSPFHTFGMWNRMSLTCFKRGTFLTPSKFLFKSPKTERQQFKIQISTPPLRGVELEN